ncbi:hypothetical protein [Tissierella pigra]|uniref:hypothetical protein n=1 Tax=Tissierella pigra TaxID=2607614 RepID=UPI0018A6B30E|nr:hypothetical protein [Tissierella pigra]
MEIKANENRIIKIKEIEFKEVFSLVGDGIEEELIKSCEEYMELLELKNNITNLYFFDENYLEKVKSNILL